MSIVASGRARLSTPCVYIPNVLVYVYMEDITKALIEYEGKTYWLDLSKFGKGGIAVVDVIEKDGTRRKATGKDVSLWDLMNEGHVIGRELPTA
ncbi:MAG: hypothetical protein Q7S26_03835 [bacterium]|nr:hypothetical protein [bacterium]